MDLDLTEKVVLITDGGKGIGYAYAAAFVAEGARVALVSRSETSLAAAAARLAAQGHKAFYLSADLS